VIRKNGQMRTYNPPKIKSPPSSLPVSVGEGDGEAALVWVVVSGAGLVSGLATLGCAAGLVVGSDDEVGVPGSGEYTSDDEVGVLCSVVTGGEYGVEVGGVDESPSSQSSPSSAVE